MAALGDPADDMTDDQLRPAGLDLMDYHPRALELVALALERSCPARN